MSPKGRALVVVAVLVALVCVTMPSSFAEAAAAKRMHALAHRTAAHMSTAADASAAANAKGDAGGEFGPCKTCVFVLERIKKGTNMLLPSICTELYTQFPTAYAMCHQVLNALSLNGNNVRYWLFEGCYKYEIYQAKEWVKPCPSHIMCSVLKELGGSPFCKPMPMEDPFAFSGESAGASA